MRVMELIGESLLLRGDKYALDFYERYIENVVDKKLTDLNSFIYIRKLKKRNL